MPSKLQTYMQMADEAQRQITGSYRGWTGFLTTAARLYKYPYAEQVMIHAQRPDATACAEYDFWNEKMGRYVRRGSRGIALIDSSGERPRLRYVFDVSDTGGRELPKSRYQFLNTVSLKADEFRPADLPDGWDHSPEMDERNWLTKQTELAYYNFCADESFRQNYFLEKFERVSWWEHHQGKDQILAAVLKKNPRFINESVYAKRLEAEADKIAEQYAVGRLIVAGDNRYLSGDLLDFLNCLPVTKTGTSKKANTFINFRWGLELNHQNFFAPGAAYESGHVCTLLRNPHIARNEEMQLYPLEERISI